MLELCHTGLASSIKASMRPLVWVKRKATSSSLQGHELLVNVCSCRWDGRVHTCCTDKQLNKKRLLSDRTVTPQKKETLRPSSDCALISFMHSSIRNRPAEPCRSWNNLDAFTGTPDTLMCFKAQKAVWQLPVKKHMVMTTAGEDDSSLSVGADFSFLFSLHLLRKYSMWK